LEWKRLKAQASLLGTFVFEEVTRRQEGGRLPGGTQATGTPNNKQEYTPALFLSYRPFHKTPLDIRAFYKRIFRMPTFNDLYYTDVGNVALLPEYTTQYNAGLQYEKPLSHPVFHYIRLKADAYCNEVTDKIIAVPKGNGQYRWMMMNLGYVEIRGFETSAQLALQLPCEVRMRTGLNYTFQRAQDFSDPADNRPGAGTYGGQIAYIPRHSASMICSMERKSWNLNYSFIYVGERYHNSSNIRENYEPAWYTHDLTLARSFKLKRLRWRLSAEINNLFNQQYDVVLNYPMPGRNYKLIIKLDL
jgi:outer membrane receptor protein involved in Fe transport